MAYTYTTINGQRVEVTVAAAFQRMRAGFKSRFGLDLLVTSGTRTRAEQQRLYDLYTAGKGNLAAAPGYSNHEEDGPRGPRALDIRDSGGDAGVTVRNTPRANWLKANAPTYGFDPAGYRFSSVEPWHYEFTGSLNGSSGGGGSSAIISLNEKLGTDYVRALQTQLGVTVDGNAGTGTNKAYQSKIGATPDGVIGSDSTLKTQIFVGAGQDSIWGNETTTKLKAAIDANKFAPTPPPADPLQRTAKTVGSVNKRSQPTTAVATIDPGVPAGGTVTIKSYAVGESVNGINVWYRLSDDTWAWSGGFTSQSTDGVPLESVTVPETPQPTVPAGSAFGIDIAWPQTGTFDWTAVKSKYDFAIIKAAGAEDGLYGPADLMESHLAGARSVDMRVGFYFFNNNRLPIRDQADKFIEVVTPRIQPGDIVALDIENVGSQPVAFNPEQALEFAGYVEAALGVKTFMYLNRSLVNNGDWSKVVEAGHPLWLATLDGLSPALKYFGGGSVKWWDSASVIQFSSTTPIVGYPSGNVDQNIARAADLEAFGFVGIPSDGETDPTPPVDIPDPVDPTTPDTVPSWFQKFIVAVVGFLKMFFGVK